MDGPNVNKSFQKKLEDHLMQKDKKILDIGTCSIHPVHTSFVKGLNKLSFDFDRFVNELNFFFKLSSARRRDYELCSLITDIESAFMIRHVASRWLTLKKALIRARDQWPNLCEYFLVFLPKEKNFPKEIETTERYKFLKNILLDKRSQIYISFAIYVADILEVFLIKFQSSKPLVHLLYPAFGDLFFKLMTNFIKPSVLIKTGTTNRLDAIGLGLLDLKSNMLPIKDIDFGSKCHELLLTIDREKDVLILQNEFVNMYNEIVVYLQGRLPYNSTILKDVQYFNPKKKLTTKGKFCFTRTARSMAVVLGKNLTKNLTIDQFVDIVKSEYTVLQIT